MRVTKILFCKLVILLFFCNQTLAQDEQAYIAPQGLNNYYAEIGGSALFYSLNYEKYLYRTFSDMYTYTARIGVGYTPFDNDILATVYIEKGTFMIPFSFCVLKGTGKEKLEIGAGFTMESKDFSNREILPHAIIGLRVMETNKVCFRLCYSPIYRQNGLIHWVGISIGRNFSFK
jgi:hypothetical protein